MEAIVKSCFNCKHTERSTEGTDCGACLDSLDTFYPAWEAKKAGPKFLGINDEQKFNDILNASLPVDTEGTKHDQGKARMSLLDTSWLLGVAEVLGFGEKKYAAHNWRKGLSVSRLMDAAARHQAAFNDGEDLDPESGKSHLYHASCCLMFASWMIKNRPDLDDRWKP
jgi:hypothetical protein